MKINVENVLGKFRQDYTEHLLHKCGKPVKVLLKYMCIIGNTNLNSKVTAAGYSHLTGLSGRYGEQTTVRQIKHARPDMMHFNFKLMFSLILVLQYRYRMRQYDYLDYVGCTIAIIIISAVFPIHRLHLDSYCLTYNIQKAVQLNSQAMF